MTRFSTDRGQLKSALFEPPEPANETRQRAHLKHQVGQLGYGEQVEAVKPPVPAMSVQALADSAVQHKGAGGDAESIKAAAQQGLQGPAGSLPHLERIQAAFGGHDVTGVQAYTGGAAAKANEAMGSRAYATGNAVAFSAGPDLHTAAHEAAHVVQQRGGVQLDQGVGKAGDAYEQHADAVADRVVQGRSAQDLLGGAGGGGAGDDVQHLLGGLKDFLKSAKDFITNPKETLYNARLAMEGRQEEVLGAAHEISNQDIILEQLAHAGAYGRLDLSKLGAWGYLEAGRVQDPESGFTCVLYAPTPEVLAGATPEAKVIQAMHGGAVEPVLAFAGTNPKESRDISDDVNRAGVGAYQFISNIGKVKGVMDAAGGPVIVTGHSLGGALAQHAACNFPANIARVVTFQSPGIPESESAKLAEYNASVAPEDRVRSTHHRAEGDIVHAAGESLTEGDVYEFESVGIGNAADHMQFPLARLAMARGGLIPGLEGGKAKDKLVRVNKSKADKVKGDVANKIAEWGRVHLGGLVRDKDMEPYIAVWQDVQKMCQTGEYSLKYILGIVEAAAKLTEVQRIKMRDNVKMLYEHVLG